MIARLQDLYKKNTDIRIFAVLIPLINVINYYLTYSHIGFDIHTLLTFCIDTVEGYIAWLGVRFIIQRLDRSFPYEVNPVRRISVQVASTFLLGTSVIILLTEAVNWMATDKPVPRSFYTQDILIISIWFFVVNGIYIGLHFYKLMREIDELRKKEQQISIQGFTVKTTKKELLLQYKEIAGVYVEGDYSILITQDDKKHLVDQSLDSVEKMLPAPFFFRLNRQYIIHRQLITGYTKGEMGKISVLLKEKQHLPSAISVSRIKAAIFKSWFMPQA